MYSIIDVRLSVPIDLFLYLTYLTPVFVTALTGLTICAYISDYPLL